MSTSNGSSSSPIGSPGSTLVSVARAGSTSSGSGVRAWLWLLIAAALVGLLAMTTNITPLAQEAGGDQCFAVFRKTINKLTNAGVLWASVAVFGGWLVQRPWKSMLAGVLGHLTALLVHYGVADLAGTVPWTDMAGNRYWFIQAVVLGLPLGLVGALSRRLDMWRLLARLVLPVGAIIEPFYLGMLSPLPFDIWSNRISGVIAGYLMVIAGINLSIVVIVRWRTKRRIGRIAETATKKVNTAR